MGSEIQARQEYDNESFQNVGDLLLISSTILSALTNPRLSAADINLLHNHGISLNAMSIKMRL